MTRLFRFALATVLSTLALIAIGSLARLHPAGTGCGNDWPRCNGSWLPPLAWAPLVEYAHRVVAVTVIAFATTTALTAFRTPGVSSKGRLFAAAGLGAILIQGVIGGFAARWGAPAGIAIAHLAAAILFLALALLTLAVAAAGARNAALAGRTRPRPCRIRRPAVCHRRHVWGGYRPDSPDLWCVHQRDRRVCLRHLAALHVGR